MIVCQKIGLGLSSFLQCQRLLTAPKQPLYHYAPLHTVSPNSPVIDHSRAGIIYDVMRVFLHLFSFFLGTDSM